MPAAVGPLVEEELAPDALVVRGEARDRSGDQGVHVGVARDEEVGPAVAVHVRHGRAGVPAEGHQPVGSRALAEGAVAVVPEHPVADRRGHVEVGVAIAVEVGGDAAVAADLQPGARARGHVDEPPAHVVEELAARQAAVPQPAREIRVRVRVDDEQVHPAVVVVVDPADAAAHHGGGIAGHAVAERALAEVDADLLRHVLQAHGGKALRGRACGRRADDRRPGDRRRGRRGRKRRNARAARPDDPETTALELQVERLHEARRLPGTHREVGRVAVGREHHAPAADGDDRRWRLALAGLEMDLDPIDAVGRDAHSACAGRSYLRLQSGQPGAGRRQGGARAVPQAQRVCLCLQIGDHVAGDLRRHAAAELRLDAARAADRHVRQPRDVPAWRCRRRLRLHSSAQECPRAAAGRRTPPPRSARRRP